MLDGVETIRTYIDRLVTGDDKCRGMKVLLLDASTTQVISAVYSQTEILSKEVYLVTRLDDQSNPKLQKNGSNSEKSSSHLKAVVFVRPTEINVGLLVRELARPHFAEYHIFFSCILTTGLLRLLAENDSQERVKQVQEFYGDFVPINEDLLTLQCRHTLAMTQAAGTSWAMDHADLYDRNLQGLQAMLLALKRQPSAIRYARASAAAEQLARDVQEHIQSDQIFHFRRRTIPGEQPNGGMLLLVLDRKDDPVTPLLSQWTYQAMVHELLGLNNNRVKLKGAPNITQELEEVVLSASQDDFFKTNRHKNFGELGEAIQKLLHEYQRQTQQKNNLNTIEDMQRFMEQFPELRSRSHNVSKHVAIMGELARLVDACNLMDVSQFEQELACADDHASHVRELMEKLGSPHIQNADKLRLGLLYALRYEHSGNLHKLKSAMNKGGVKPDMMQLLDVMLRYGGSGARGPGLYGHGASGNNLMSKMTKNILTSVQGVSNVYSQHVPVLMDTIQQVMRGKLRSDAYPYMSSGGGSVGNGLDAVPNEILVFMVGGVTYEEATKVSEFNEANSGRMRIILGGSTVHNSTSFLEELKALP